MALLIITLLSTAVSVDSHWSSSKTILSESNVANSTLGALELLKDIASVDWTLNLKNLAESIPSVISISTLKLPWPVLEPNTALVS